MSKLRRYYKTRKEARKIKEHNGTAKIEKRVFFFKIIKGKIVSYNSWLVTTGLDD